MKTPRLKTNIDSHHSLILNLIGGTRTARGELQPGLIEISHWSPDCHYEIEDIDNGDTLEEMGDIIREGKWITSYGVADTPEQAFEHAKQALAKAGRTGEHCVFVTHITKDLSNAGQGGGWRWHKWGEYIGKGAPMHEYLDDEPGFENGVWTFHIYRVIE